MSDFWLVLDCNYLCHRACNAMGGLAFNDQQTGTVYGFLKDVCTLQDRFDTDKVVFCFDSDESLREAEFAGYKQSRRDAIAKMSVTARKLRNDFRMQVRYLCTRYLPAIGYKNVFCANGYEADDIIASVCLHSLKENARAIIVSEDQDLYQLLNGRVAVWSPRKGQLVTANTLRAAHGVGPADWPMVKALAGCKSDDIPGVEGIGDVYAKRWVRGELKEKSKQREAIVMAMAFGEVARWLRLVELPFKGCPKYQLATDQISVRGWERVARKLGFKSLINKPPMSKRQSRARMSDG